MTTCAARGGAAETVTAPDGAAEGSCKYVPIRFVALITAVEEMVAPVMVSTFCPGFAGSSRPMNWSVKSGSFVLEPMPLVSEKVEEPTMTPTTLPPESMPEITSIMPWEPLTVA